MEDSTFIICIPSYHRENICNTKTLTCLSQHNINPELINVYVADEIEYEVYLNELDKSKYNKLIIGEKGLVQQRKFITNSFSDGEYIVFLDDDIAEIDLSLFSTEVKLNDFIQIAFTDCVKYKSFIWGVYAVFNPFFRQSRKDLTRDLNYIVGAFYGIINRKLTELELTITEQDGQKEDVERTLKYFIQDGIVLRYNKIGFVTKYYGKVGGLGQFKERIIPMAVACEKLKEEYSNYGRIKIRKNGMYEFVLKKIKCKI